jgi:hypothetical protein
VNGSLSEEAASVRLPATTAGFLVGRGMLREVQKRPTYFIALALMRVDVIHYSDQVHHQSKVRSI